MKYLVVAPGYPSKENIYSNGFVHERVKLYLENNLNVEVFSYTFGPLKKYIYENVQVYEGGKEAYLKFINKNKYDKYLIHFGYKKIVNPILEKDHNSKLFIWVHGAEALGWYRRLFYFNFKEISHFIRYIVLNVLQLNFMRKLIKSNYDLTFVFVSKWMKNILEHDSYTINKIKKYVIIPNVINDEEFNYLPKKKEDRLKILSIRTYQSKKYANDLMVKAILELSKENFFNELNFNIYGDGRLFNKTLKPLRSFSNVHINQKFLNHREISEIHKENGIMLIPTRQDAQGVSMCEAMSSGLVPVTSNNTAIPEYVNEKCGYLTNNYHELAMAIKEMYYNSDIFLSKSQEASKFINNLCAPSIVTKKEIELITKQ